jgi:hypothetical protein
MFVWKRKDADDTLTVQPLGSNQREIPVMKVDGTTGLVSFLKGVVDPNSEALFRATIGAETSNAIDIAVRIVNQHGKAIKRVRAVRVRTLPVTDAQGTLGAASAAVGVIKKTTSAAGEKTQWMECNANGLFSFKVTDTVAEDCLVEIAGEGCRPTLIKLTFA